MRGRAGHTANVVGKYIYVFGGRNGNEFFNDMWAFDTEIEQWKLVQAEAPFPPRAYHTSTLVNQRELWVIGGSDQLTMYSDVHVFDTASLKWSSPVTSGISANKQRGTHAAVLHPLQRDSILVYGGYGGTESCWLSDLVLLHTHTLEWEELKPEGSSPSRRGYHTLTAFGTCVALFGGKAEGGILKKDMLSIYDAATNRWSIPSVKGEPPSPRSNHASALLEDRLIIVHGGRHGSSRLSDTYLLQVPPVDCYVPNLELRWHLVERSKNTPLLKKSTGKTDSPSGRSAHSLVSRDQALYLFGGYGGQGITLDDMFILRKLPILSEVEKMKRNPLKLADGQAFIDVSEESEGEEAQEGWRSTKRPKLHFGALKMRANVLQQEPEVRLDRNKNKVQEACDTRSTEPMTEDCVSVKKREISSLEDRTIAMIAREKELYQKEVRSLQQSVESLKSTIREKALVDSEFRERSVQLEKELQRLQKEKSDLQITALNLEKELALHSKRGRKLEAENKTIKASMQDMKSELEDKENSRKMEVSKGCEQEKKLKDQSKSLEEVKAVASEAVIERDRYKSCMQKLEAELEKQMDALRQISSKYETEKDFLLNEVAERKGTADKLLTELGASKEHARALEETINHQLRQIEQEAAKVDMLQKENEAAKCSNAVMASEHKQLIEGKEVAEANCRQLQSKLQAAQLLVDQNVGEISRLKEVVEQTRQHASALHDTLKKSGETLRVQVEENEKFRAMMRETEEFEQAQARLIQTHAEKLRCARQSCPR